MGCVPYLNLENVCFVKYLIHVVITSMVIATINTVCIDAANNGGYVALLIG